jgi:hypothetical protein
VSPRALLTQTLAWFAATFTRGCSTATCPDVLDVRLERGRLSCSRCGATIRGRVA